MAKLRRQGQSLRRRAVQALDGGAVERLESRIATLEAEIQENRQLNVRLAELIDVVTELLVPVASQDKAKIESALEKFSRSLG
ncbi:MAG: hypothetical protein M3130_02880 [Actinomycetota bacterium]|nr:hypothetical protein [Actinomycetota bacterium]